MRSFLAATLGKWVIDLLLATCRITIQGNTDFTTRRHLIVSCWHNRIVILPALFNRYTTGDFIAIVSHSRDGKLIDALVSSYKRGSTLSVPHLQRRQVLSQIIEIVKEGKKTVFITPDGPRGPCYQLKPGLPLIAKGSGGKIVPVTWTANRYWELPTWDKMRIPKPFSRIVVSIGDPLDVPDEDPRQPDQLTRLLL